MSICLPVCLPVCLPFLLSVCLFVCLFTCLIVCLFTCLIVYIFVLLFVYLSGSIHLYIRSLSISLPFYLIFFIRKEKEESIADIAKYKATKEAEANTLLYTDQYVQLEMAKALTENTKVYFSGQNSELGAIMSKLFKTET